MVRPLALVVLLSLAPVAGWAQSPPATLTDVQRLRAENLRLRLVILQQQQQALQESARRLDDERRGLEAEFRAALQPPATHVFNWLTLSFDPPPSEVSRDIP